MALYPIDKTLQKSYRDTLSIPSAPAFIESDMAVIPVAVIANTSNAASNVSITDGTDTMLIDTDGALVTKLPKATGNQTEKSARSQFAGGGASVQIYTNTAGKTFYLTALTFNVGGANSEVKLRDGVADSGTVKVDFQQLATTPTQHFIFPTPIPFASGVRFDLADQPGGTNNFTVWGFEE